MGSPFISILSSTARAISQVQPMLDKLQVVFSQYEHHLVGEPFVVLKEIGQDRYWADKTQELFTSDRNGA